MTSIQKQAAELAEEWETAVKNGHYLTTGGSMAALLRQIASMGGDVEPVAEIVLQDIGAPFKAMQVRAHFFSAPPTPGGKLFTQQALDAARLAGFEAGRNKGWAVRKIESLIQERDAAIARADSAFEDGRRSQQEENQRLLAEVCRLQPLAEQRDAAFERATTARNAALLEVAELCAGNEELSAAIMQLYWKPPRDEFAEGILEMIKKSRP